MFQLRFRGVSQHWIDSDMTPEHIAFVLNVAAAVTAFVAALAWSISARLRLPIITEPAWNALTKNAENIVAAVR